MTRTELDAVARRVEERLTATPWTDQSPAATEPVEAAAEVATFALGLSGRRRQARRGGRPGRLIAQFALAAALALATVSAACEKPDASPEATATAIAALPSASASEASVTAQPRASPARYRDLVLIDAGNDTDHWVLMAAASGDPAPVLIDRTNAGLDMLGAVYQVPAQPVVVGTRDGRSQFLAPLAPVERTADSASLDPTRRRGQLEAQWQTDERFAAPTRAIAGRPSVLDAAYNAAQANTAGGTHTYTDGVVLRVEADKPVLEVIDRALLESGRPTRAEDLVYVAIRPAERSLYEPGQVVNLRNVVVDRQQTDVQGQSTLVYVVNAALDGARVEPTGKVDLQSLLQDRLQRTDQTLASEASLLAPAPAATPAATSTPGTTPIQPPVVVNHYSGPTFIEDFLIWTWLTSGGGWYRGSGGVTIINNAPPSPTRPTGDYYYVPPASAAPNAPYNPAEVASRSTAIQSARGAISGQASGTGGGVAATTKSAADASARASAATTKAASVAGDVSSASVGKSIASVPASSSTTAARSSGALSGSRAAPSVSTGSRGGVSAGGGTSGGFGGKGISGAGSS